MNAGFDTGGAGYEHEDEPTPFATEKLDLDSRKHREKVEWVITRLRYSQESKREIERMGQLAYNHYNSYLNLSKHPWAATAYDPVLFGTIQEQLADVSEAMWASPPIFDFEPEGFTTYEEARNATALCGYHLDCAGIMGSVRRTYNDSIVSRHCVGTTFQHFFWDKQLRYEETFKRVPVEVETVDPATGQPHRFWIEEGGYKYVRELVPVIDSPNIKDLHITQVFPDPDVPCVQRGEWFIVRDVISAIDARERVKTDGWDKRAVERALRQPIPTGANTGLVEIVDWQTSIGLATATTKRALFTEGDKGREAVEVLECWYREENELRRIVLLNQSWICWYGPSPYGALYPFVDSRAYTKSNEFWGLSDYQIGRYMFRTVQTLLNAGVSELMINAMPPILYNSSSIQSTAGWRWEPRALWPVAGDINQIKWFENSGQSFGMARTGMEFIQGRVDNALASGDAQRGGQSRQTASSTASAMNLVAQAAGQRTKLRVDNHNDDMIKPGARLYWNLIRRFQNYECQVRLLGQKAGVPVTLYPENFRGSRLRPLDTAASAANKDMKSKRMLDLYDLMVLRAKSQSVNEPEMARLIAESAAPEHVEKIIVSQDERNAQMQQQMQAQGIPGQVRGNVPPPPQNGSSGYAGFQPMTSGADPTAEYAQQLAGAMQ